MRRSLFTALIFSAFAFGAVGCSDVIPALEDGDELRATGDRCLADNECMTGHCECEDFECDRRFCTVDDCLCGYGTSGACESPLTGRPDPEDCDMPNTTCGAIGACDVN